MFTPRAVRTRRVYVHNTSTPTVLNESVESLRAKLCQAGNIVPVCIVLRCYSRSWNEAYSV